MSNLDRTPMPSAVLPFKLRYFKMYLCYGKYSDLSCLTVHKKLLSCFLLSQDPQVVTGSHDTTIKFWDLVAGNSSVKWNTVYCCFYVYIFITVVSSCREDYVYPYAS